MANTDIAEWAASRRWPAKRASVPGSDLERLSRTLSKLPLVLTLHHPLAGADQHFLGGRTRGRTLGHPPSQVPAAVCGRAGSYNSQGPSEVSNDAVVRLGLRCNIATALPTAAAPTTRLSSYLTVFSTLSLPKSVPGRMKWKSA